MFIIIMRKSTLRKKLVEATKNGQDAGITVGLQLGRNEIKPIGSVIGTRELVQRQVEEIVERKGF